MKQIFNFGDVHFAGLFKYQIELSNKFLNWFEQYDFGKQSDIVSVWLGDLCDKSVNAGDVDEQKERWAKICSNKFSMTYVLQGNHDFKDTNGRLQSDLQWLNQKDCFKVIDKPEILQISFAKIICLPFIRVENNTLEKYYAECLPEEFYNTKADYIIGHVAKQTNELIAHHMSGMLFDKFVTKDLVLGHIHIPINSCYTGSLWPLNHAEVIDKTIPYNRTIKIYNDNTTWDEIKVPDFVQFNSVKYPEAIQKINDDLIHIFTVQNCKNLQVAKNYYNVDEKTIVIKNVEKTIEKNDVLKSNTEQNTLFTYETPIDALNDFIKETKISVSRPLYAVLKDALSA
jgi:hypothetical protein